MARRAFAFLSEGELKTANFVTQHLDCLSYSVSFIRKKQTTDTQASQPVAKILMQNEKEKHYVFPNILILRAKY